LILFTSTDHIYLNMWV